MGVFCRATLSQCAEDYAKALADKGLKYSTCANYCNSLCMVGSYVYDTFEVDADALALPTTPLDELLRLRSQCESQAKQQALYSRRDPEWLEWDDAQYECARDRMRPRVRSDPATFGTAGKRASRRRRTTRRCPRRRRPRRRRRSRSGSS